jgi:hypothetical protein
MKIKTGNIEETKTVRAGCGLRYDPDQLGEDTGFDFSLASLFQSKEDKESDHSCKAKPPSSDKLK